MAARPQYNVLSICSGVGGLELGVRIARPDAVCVAHIEREIAAAEVLAARMQDGSIHEGLVWSDLSTFDPRPFAGIVDCITSGDPCQPNSIAGKRLGADDDRWLLDHVLRVIEGVRPARVFRENVTGNADGQLAAIVPALERMGYRVASGIFSAGEDAEASHRRERLFIMADLECERLEGGAGGRNDREGRPAIELASGAGKLGNPIRSRNGRFAPKSGRGKVVGNVADGAGGFGVPLFAPGPSDPRWPSIISQRPDLSPALTEAEAESVFCGMDAWLAGRVDRLRECGNGVSSLAASVAWLTLEARLAA